MLHEKINTTNNKNKNKNINRHQIKSIVKIIDG